MLHRTKLLTATIALAFLAGSVSAQELTGTLKKVIRNLRAGKVLAFIPSGSIFRTMIWYSPRGA